MPCEPGPAGAHVSAPLFAVSGSIVCAPRTVPRSALPSHVHPAALADGGADEQREGERRSGRGEAPEGADTGPDSVPYRCPIRIRDPRVATSLAPTLNFPDGDRPCRL